LPLLGSRSEFSSGILGEIEKSLLEEERVVLEDFRLSKTPEFRVEGSIRAASVEVAPEINLRHDQLSGNGNLVVDVQFSLPKASYATTILREFMKTNPLNY
jgi:tRNA pseudouridine13 synthase